MRTEFTPQRDIKVGEELLYDYGYGTQTKCDNGKGLDCLCGSKHCRGRLLQ
jgi:SET domain-containing protein